MERLIGLQQALLCAKVRLHPSESDSETAQREETLKKVRQRLIQLLTGEKNACYTVGQLAVGGQELLEAGVLPGRPVGETLRWLLEAVITGRVENRREDLLAYLSAGRQR